jgi:2-haloacid dehalogenase
MTGRGDGTDMARTAALCFDMYGTLCDTSSVTRRLGEVLGVSGALADAVDETWRRKQLQYSYQAAQMDAYEPFWEITTRALDYGLARYGLDPSDDDRARIVEAYDHLSPYPDAAPTLERLGDAGYTVTVLSNGNPEMLERLAANAGLAPHLDDVLSADEVRTFKPTPAVYENAARRLGVDIEACRLVSANAWDAAGAGNAGMGVAWVNRRRDPPEAIGPTPEIEVEALAGLPAALGADD